MPELDDYLQQNRRRFEEDLRQLLQIPSISADSRHAADVRRAAEWITQELRALKFETELLETKRHPLVYAASPPVPGRPTVLVYGHYDVQPPDPLDEWISPPFQPTVRDGNIYARGATDDKGQMLTHIESVRAWMETSGKLPLQIKFLVEGEEEVGSESLQELLQREPQRLACDAVVISDSSQFAPGQPAITYGLRGIAYYELRLRGPKQDLHSGTFGGGVANPANALTRMLAALIDDQGRIQISGFYDQVVPLGDAERRRLAALNFDERQFAERLGVKTLSGEAGFSNLEHRWARPTFDINGIWGGYQGEGGKTVLPARAGAKFSFRLVPNQEPHQVTQSLRARLEELCPPGIAMELIDMHGAPGLVISPEGPLMSAAARAIERGFGRAPVFIREGGSIPIVSAFHETLKADILLLGWGLDDDNTHSPNEKFCLADFHRGIRSSAFLWEELSRLGAH